MKNKSNIGICQLCLKEKPLINAHIFSKFLFKPLMDDKNRMVQIDKKKDNIKINIYAQDAFWDRNILCERCDNDLGNNYEDPIVDVFHDDDGRPRNMGFIAKDQDHSFVAINLDFDIFNKFLLTQLWRMSISKGSGFSGVDLGEYHNERIRIILYENQQINENEYPVIVLITKSSILKGNIMPAVFFKVDSFGFYQFKIHQFIYWIFVNSPTHELPPSISKFTIKRSAFKAYQAPENLDQKFNKALFNMINSPKK